MQRRQLADLAERLTAQTGELRALETKVAAFPDSASDERRAVGKLPDLEDLQNVAQIANVASKIEAKKVQDSGTSPLGQPGQVVLSVGNGSITLSAAHSALLLAVLEIRGSLKREELTGLRVPERPKDVNAYLARLTAWRKRIAVLQAELTELEAELNDAAYALYGLTTDEREVIEGFLARY